MVSLPAVLAIDDDPRFLQSMKTALSSRYAVHLAQNSSSAAEVMAQNPPKVILLDFDLGSENGHDLLKSLNTNPSRPPVIVISGKVDLKMAVGFLNLQIFGFLEKPILLADLQTLLDQAINNGTQSEIIKDSDFEMNLATRTVFYQGQEIYLTQTQIDIISLLVSKKGTIITRDELTEKIWGKSHISRNALDTHLLNIKKKLPPIKAGLRVIHGRGYCYED
ncbi:response regulator transcription factor [Bdellovibrio bacteriovorus]|uniref:response regulator transcription factor n=1 Tax=Bdellovibrio bacteriovorus TaxID=959 RepID=UPI0021D0540D|nr:response regulator transcription factor [Bdellovibrio bacteriovorus]UXR65340.1 response regulator transcription factor [Bdellovibrio bacteriovorus]